MVEKYSYLALMKNPLENIFLVPNPSFTQYNSVKFLRRLFEETLPSYVMDLYLRLAGRRPLFVRLQGKIATAVLALEFFTSTEWTFTNDNVYKVIGEMNEVDNKLFNVDVRSLNWKLYVEQYCLGTKKYLLKEDMTKMSKCRNQLKMLTRARNAAFALIGAFILRFIVKRGATLK